MLFHLTTTPFDVTIYYEGIIYWSCLFTFKRVACKLFVTYCRPQSCSVVTVEESCSAADTGFVAILVIFFNREGYGNLCYLNRYMWIVVRACNYIYMYNHSSLHVAFTAHGKGDASHSLTCTHGAV